MKIILPIFSMLLILAGCTNAPITSTETTQSGAQAATTAITLATLKTHSTQADCWTSIRGDVYNITWFFGKHPGGDDKLLRLCGTDGTIAFTKKHSGQERPEATLASLPKVGKLQ